jgi:plastocyanin
LLDAGRIPAELLSHKSIRILTPRPVVNMQVKPLLVLLLHGCGGGGGVDPSPTTVIAKTSGDDQDGTVGRPLAKPIQVLVTEGNAPVAGATVSWLMEISDGVFTPNPVTTDANGLASTVWTLGSRQGIQRSTARVITGSTNPSVVFNATALHDVPVTLTKVTGDNQSAMAGTPLRSIVARVDDQFENGVEGVAVSWSISAGTISPRSNATSPGGHSIAQVILGDVAGPVTITATADGLTGSPLIFNATSEAVPTQAAVRLGNLFFTSDRNNSTNPAVDTVAVGASVTWTWGNTGMAEHSVRSLGTPSFTSSATKLGIGQNYTFTFTRTGTYNYDCAVHGSQMTGRIVVR